MKISSHAIIIADDHDIVRAGIKFLVEEQEHLHIEDEASSFSELMKMLEKRRYDFLILDLNLGDRNGTDAIRQISDRFNALPILVLSMFPEDPYALHSLQSGAHGYLNKTMVSNELLLAIDTILERKTYLSQPYEETLPYCTPMDKTEKTSLESLSKREFEVYSYIVTGVRHKDIAEELSLSPKTISTYRTRILEKLSLTTTSQLIHFSLQNSRGA